MLGIEKAVAELQKLYAKRGDLYKQIVQAEKKLIAEAKAAAKAAAKTAPSKKPVAKKKPGPKPAEKQ